MKELELQNLAHTACTLDKTIKQATEELNGVKVLLREEANGEKLDIVVPEVGKVQVKTPPFTAGKTTTKTVFDESAFDNLPEKTKKLLLKEGVVTHKKVVTEDKVGTATVVVTLNV